jgi:hypothetical protein
MHKNVNEQEARDPVTNLAGKIDDVQRDPGGRVDEPNTIVFAAGSNSSRIQRKCAHHKVSVASVFPKNSSILVPARRVRQLVAFV